MADPHTFQLIDGTFTPEQARHVLCAMVKSKIDYHTLEQHSEGERSGLHSHSEERLEYLSQLDAELRQLFARAAANGKKLCVTSALKITEVDS